MIDPFNTARAPLTVLHLPHASTVIPADERASIHLSDDGLALELLRMTDHYTDELFALRADEATATSGDGGHCTTVNGSG
jgi:hypothetical protein